MDTISAELKAALSLALKANTDEKGELKNKRELAGIARTINIKRAAAEVKELLETDEAHFFQNIRYLHGLSIALNLRTLELNGKMDKFDAECEMHAARERDNQRRSKAQKGAAAAAAPDALEKLLEADIVVPDLPKMEMLPPPDTHLMPDVEPSPIRHDDLLADFGGDDEASALEMLEMPGLLETSPLPLEMMPEAEEPEMVEAPEMEENIQEVEVAEEPPVVPDVLPLSMTHVVVPAVPRARQRGAARESAHRAPRAEVEEQSAAFYDDIHELPQLELVEDADADEDGGFLTRMMPAQRPRGGPMHVEEVATASPPQSPPLLGVEDDAELPSELRQHDTMAISAIAMPDALPLQQDWSDLQPMQTEPAAYIPQPTLDVSELTPLPQPDQLGIAEEVEVEAEDDLLRQRKLQFYQMRQIHAGKKLTIRQVTPEPQDRLNLTVSFMVLPSLIREKVLRVYADEKGYLTFIEFLAK